MVLHKSIFRKRQLRIQVVPASLVLVVCATEVQANEQFSFPEPRDTHPIAEKLFSTNPQVLPSGSSDAASLLPLSPKTSQASSNLSLESLSQLILKSESHSSAADFLSIPLEESPNQDDSNLLNIPSSNSLPIDTPSNRGESDTITVKEFMFTSGNNRPLAFSQKELEAVAQEAVKKLVGHSLPAKLTFAQLLQVRSEITQFYIERGYITSGAYIPEQEFDESIGNLKIEILEGQLPAENINVTIRKPDGDVRIPDGTVTDRNGTNSKKPYERLDLKIQCIKRRLANGTLNQIRLLDSLRLLRQTEDQRIAKLSANLKAGQSPGTNQLNVDITQAEFVPKFNGFRFSVNNSRSPTIGSIQRRIQLSFDNVFKSNATVDAAYTNTEGSNSLDFALIVPSGANPADTEEADKNCTTETLKVLFGFPLGSNNIIEQPFNRLDIESRSSYVDVTLQRTAYPRSNIETALSFTGSFRKSSTSLLGIDLPLTPDADEEGKTRIFALRVAREQTHRGRQSILSWRTELSGGGNGGRRNAFIVLRGQGQWVYQLAPETLLVTRANFQFSPSALPALEQIGLGGQYTVRGYRQDFLLTDSGVNASLELLLPILRFSRDQGAVQLIPFIDFGSAWNNEGEALSNSTLWSAGLGLQIRRGDFRARIDWGIPLISVDASERSLQERGIYFTVEGVWNPF